MAPPPGTLSALAAKISAAAAVIDGHFAATNTPGPSFDIDTPTFLPFVPEVQNAKTELIDALEDLQTLTLGPADYFAINLLSLAHDMTVYHVLNEFDVWNAVPLHGTATYAEISRKTGLGQDTIIRVLRHAMTKHVFTSPKPDTIAHTSLSAYFVKEPLARAWLGHNTDDIWPSAVKLVEAIRTFGESGEPNETGAAIALFKGRKDVKNFFDWADQDGDGDKKGYRVKRFGEAMMFVTKNPAFNIKAIHQLYDWASLGEGPFVDIGGSMGHISVELASTYPSLKCIVEDLPPLEAPFKSALPVSLSSRVSFLPHDFFTPQPITDARVYFFKHILHDWSDAYAAKILRHIVAVLKKPEQRVLIMEGLIPELGEAPRPIVRLMSSLDMQMMVGLNARERTAKNWATLLQLADERLEVKAIHMAEGSAFVLIEAGLKT